MELPVASSMEAECVGGGALAQIKTYFETVT